MRIRRFVLAALFAAASCAPGGVRLSLQEISTAYNPGEFAYAGAGRDLRVVVVGNPFGGDQAAFDKAVTDAMQGQHWGQRTNFTSTPGPDARETYRVVLLFDPPIDFNGSHLCRRSATALPTQSSGGEIALFGAFCRGKRSLTEIKGQIDGAAGPDDPAFRALVGQVTNGLFPPDRGLLRDRDECPPWKKC